MDNTECEKISVSVRVQLVGGGTLELGRGDISLHDVIGSREQPLEGEQGQGLLLAVEELNSESERWLNIYKKGTNKLVAVVLLSVRYQSLDLMDFGGTS